MTQESSKAFKKATEPAGGVAGWLLQRLGAVRRSPARLTVVERIALAPRQSLALVEVEGRRFLVATSPEGTPAFYPLDPAARRSDPHWPASGRARISWSRILW